MNKRFRNLSMSGMLAAGLALSGAAVYAQQDNSTTQAPAQATAGEHGHGNHAAMDPDQQLAHMTQRYNLTSDQQSQIKPILVETHQQMAAVHADTSTSRQDRMAKIQSIHQDATAKISAILNPDQKQKFEQDQARMQERRQERAGHHTGDSTQPQ